MRLAAFRSPLLAILEGAAGEPDFKSGKTGPTLQMSDHQQLPEWFWALHSPLSALSCFRGNRARSLRLHDYKVKMAGATGMVLSSLLSTLSSPLFSEERALLRLRDVVTLVAA